MSGQLLDASLVCVYGVSACNSSYPFDYELQGPKLVFVKTHKTAGSTVSAVLFRHASRRHLNVYVPPGGTPGRLHDMTVSRCWELVQAPGSGLFGGSFPYDLWASHVRLTDVGRLFSAVGEVPSRCGQAYDSCSRNPAPPVLLFSSVRKPSRRFQSAFYWYQHHLPAGSVGTGSSSAGLGCSLRDLLASFQGAAAVDGIGAGAWLREIAPRFKFRTGLDSQSAELMVTGPGAGRGVGSEEVAFSALLAAVRRGSLFLLVAERFDESLLVLRRLAGPGVEPVMSLLDLVYLPLKGNSGHYVAPALSESELQLLGVMQPRDSALYSAACTALDARISSYDRGGVFNFVADLKQLQGYVRGLGVLCADFGVELGTAVSLSGGNCSQCSDSKIAAKRARATFFEARLAEAAELWVQWERSGGDAARQRLLVAQTCLYFAMDNADFVRHVRRHQMQPFELYASPSELVQLLVGAGATEGY